MLSLAQRSGGRRTERSPEFGQITHNGCPNARARGDPHRRWLRRADRPARAGAAAADDVADFFLAELLFADSGSGATMELGRSARPPMLLLPAPRSGTGSSTNDRKFCSTDRRGACSRSRSAAAAGVLNDHAVFGQITHNGCPNARARGDPHRRWLRRADRPARAGAAAADDVADFFLAELLFADSGSGATMELGRSARPPMLLVPAPRSGTGSSTNDRKFCSTDSGGACFARAALRRPATERSQNLAELPIMVALTRAREATRIGGGCAEQTDRLEPVQRRLTTSPTSF